MTTHAVLQTETLVITDAATLECQLDEAVERAIVRALASPGIGVLLTRHDHNTFSVSLSDQIPAGLTYELDLR